MRIAFHLQDFHNEGLTIILRLVQILAQKHPETDFHLSGLRAPMPKMELPNLFESRLECPPGGWWRMWRYRLQLRRELMDWKTDLLISSCLPFRLFPGLKWMCIRHSDWMSDTVTASGKIRHKASGVALGQEWEKEVVGVPAQLPFGVLGICSLPALEMPDPPAPPHYHLPEPDATPYLLYTGSGTYDEVIELLKAFSLFKKRQRTGMQLMLALGQSPDKKLRQKIDSYKYRSDLKITGSNREALAGWIQGAYTVMLPASAPGWLQAGCLHSGIPLITVSDAVIREKAGDAACYLSGWTDQELAIWMMQLYKDEPYKTRLAQRAREVAGLFSCAQTADRLWNIMLQIPDSGEGIRKN